MTPNCVNFIKECIFEYVYYQMHIIHLWR